MYSLFEVFQTRGPAIPPTEEEKTIANGTVHPTNERMKELVHTLPSTGTVPEMFGRLAQLTKVRKSESIVSTPPQTHSLLVACIYRTDLILYRNLGIRRASRSLLLSGLL